MSSNIMTDFTIGEVSKRSGLSASAIRYYEAESIVPKPARRNGRRIYDEDWMNRLGIVLIAQEAGFSLKEIRNLTRQLGNSGSSSSEQLQHAARCQLQTLNDRKVRIQQMEQLLEGLLHCHCHSLDKCGQIALRLVSPTGGKTTAS